MKKGLFYKMVTAYTIIIATFFIIVAVLLSIWFQSYYFNNIKTQFIKNASGIEKLALAYESGNISFYTLDYDLKVYADSLNADIILIDSKGYIYDVSNVQDSKIMENQISGADLDKLRNNQEITTKGNYEGLFNTESDTYIIPMCPSNIFVGAIMMNTPLSQAKQPLSKVYLIIWVMAILSIITAYFVIYFLSEKILIKPLARINEVARKITKGDVGIRVEVNSSDEIGELSKSFNDMADSIAKVENNRREFISNVSHEIRSPITSIKGFIGAIIDGVIPKEKENYYLSLAFEETQRLTRLVNDLLDLSTIEAGQFTLNMITFDINEVIRRTVLKFETIIKEKNLYVDVCFNKDSLNVVGDIDRIMQVVTNLVDNAIKYGSEGGKVNISTKVKGEKVIVSIFNESKPLTEEDLKHIWDRFYKSDKSRTTKTSTGLGLPIVRTILTQHGEDIHVKNNTKDGGVEFTFSLKRG